MSIYEKTNVARALLFWAKNNNGNECYYLEDRMYAVADGDMVIILTADSYDDAKRKAQARHTQGEWIIDFERFSCPFCKMTIDDEVRYLYPKGYEFNYCPNCGKKLKGGPK